MHTHELPLSVRQYIKAVDARCQDYQGGSIAVGDERGFSFAGCDSCGSHLGADMHEGSAILIGDGPVSDRIIDGLLLCPDCVLYHANGDLPDDWRD